MDRHITTISRAGPAKPLRAVAGTERLREETLAQIDSGALRKGDRIMPIRQLAKRYGVAFVSAQKMIKRLCEEGALEVRRGRGTYVTGKRRSSRRTGKTVAPPKNLLFVYDKSLQSLPGSRLNHFYLGVLNGAQEHASRRGYGVVYKPVDREIHGRDLDDVCDRMKTAAVLLVGEEIEHSLAFLLRDRRVPLVLVDHHIDTGFHEVLADCRTAVAQAVESLLGLGHRRIAFIGKHAEFPSVQGKLFGFRKAHEKRRLVPDENLIRSFRRMEETGSIVRDLLRSSRRPSAIVAEHDYVALKVIEAAGEAGFRVPDQLSVIGCDDIEPAASSSPPLSTIRIDTERMGRIAAEMLLDSRKKPVRRYVHGAYVERRSTAAPPK